MAEKRLIDASPENAKSVLGGYPYYPDEIWKFAAMAERFPTVDAVPVVRCKDCKRCFKHTTKRNRQKMWICIRNEVDVCVRPDDFCSYGERKGGDGNG